MLSFYINHMGHKKDYGITKVCADVIGDPLHVQQGDPQAQQGIECWSLLLNRIL